jgi:hypothetical protein
MLPRALFVPLVIAFWCLTSGWLFVAKILPALQPGSPPGYKALYAPDGRIVPVAWTVLWNNVPVGWALTEAERTDDNGLDVTSRLHFQRLPLDEMLPSWAGALVQRLVAREAAATFDATGRLFIDEEGRLQRFLSVVHVPGTGEQIRLEGAVDDGMVQIAIRAGDLHYDTRRHLPSHIMIGDELSPQASLPGLYQGRRWTVPIYSPLRPGHSPLEILHAEVTGEETIYWEDGLVRANVVAYREDPTSDQEPRCRLWVDRTGRVLRQEAAMLGARVAFVRRSDDDAARLAASDDLGEQPPPAPSPRLPEPSSR